MAVAAAVVAAVAVVSFLSRDGGGESAAPVAARSDSTDAVISALERRVEEAPEDADSRVMLANAYLQKARENGDPSLYTRAGEELDRAEESGPPSADLLATRGILALARHEFAAALEFGERAVEMEPGRARFHGVVGDARIELGRYEEAVGSYQTMVGLRPDFESYNRVAHARELHGDPEGAALALEDALAAGSPSPENVAWTHVQLGNLRFTTQDLDDAEDEYERSLRTLPRYPLALAGKGRVAAARGDLGRAAELHRSAFEGAPLSEHAIALGDVYAEMGREEKADEQYEVVRAMDRLFRANGVNTDLEISLFLADHDIRLADSLGKARSAYEARPSIHAADALAWTLYKSGQYEEARRYSDEALRLGTRDPVKLFHAGMISKKLGRSEEAERHLREAVELNPRFSVLHADTAAAALGELEASSGEGE